MRKRGQRTSTQMDLRGWGDSTGLTDARSYSMRDLASDIEEGIIQLNLGEFVLAGHSIGGKIAQLVASCQK